MTRMLATSDSNSGTAGITLRSRLRRSAIHISTTMQVLQCRPASSQSQAVCSTPR